jgi:enediyne biosynthesis protein E4
MIDHEVLPYLPQDAITEANVTFLAEDKGKFRPVPGWGLDAMESGRSMALADLDNDGRLDVVVNNLNAPAKVFENRLCSARGSGRAAGSTEIRLRWIGKQNSAAFGATVRVRTTAGILTRLVSPTGGYLTGLDGTVHVGLGGAGVNSIDVTWPDGATSKISRNAAQGGFENQLVTIIRAGTSAGDSNG